MVKNNRTKNNKPTMQCRKTNMKKIVSEQINERKEMIRNHQSRK